MKVILIFRCIFWLPLMLCSQEWKIEVGYNYLYANQWDKYIQTYNFSRPFLTTKQPLLQNGWCASLSHLFSGQKNIQQGIQVSYSYFSSYAKEDHFSNRLTLHFIQAGYFLHFRNKRKWKDFYSEIMGGVRTSGLFRKSSSTPSDEEEIPLHAMGIGGEISYKIGYTLQVKKKYSIAPFLLIGFTPFIYAPNSEVILNQTQNLWSNQWNYLLNIQTGLSLSLKKSRT
jgi:hypothetical protein